MLIKDKVEQLLTEVPQTRDNDRLLIARTLDEMFNIKNLYDVALCKEIKGNIYETIRRCRAKIQETNPSLRPSEEVYRARLINEQIIREEMRGL